MTMYKISELAESIRSERAAEKSKKEKEEMDELEKKLLWLKEEFEIAFKDVLPLLEEAGIKYSLHYQNEKYFDGAYVLFKKENLSVKMDFRNRISYRYEFVKLKDYGGSSFGDWSMNDFILFIDEALLFHPPIIANV